MGHLLSTVNPEAAGAIQPAEDPFAIRAAEIGEVVHYFARPGEGRSGKTKFPAVVMHVGMDGPQRGWLELLVIYGVDDQRGYINIRRKTHDETMNVWDFIPGALGNAGDINLILRSLFGGNAVVEDSVYDMIKMLAKRLTKVEASNKALSDRLEMLGADEVEPPAKEPEAAPQAAEPMVAEGS